MADKTGIEWADATWNPVVGCSIVSKGCTNCYAMKQAARLLDRPGSHYEGTTKSVNGNAVWTGKLALAPDNILFQPLRWKRPRRIFVNSMGDLFHPDTPIGWIDKVLAIMALCPQHTFQVLTKRPEIMQAYFSAQLAEQSRRRIARVIIDLVLDKKIPAAVVSDENWPVESIGDIDMPDDILLKQWPLPNVWLGVSIEDQATADERIPHLLNTPAAIRFLSCEPLLGPVDLKPRAKKDLCLHCGQGPDARHEDHPYRTDGIDWVIVGGESGPSARPMHPAWIRQLRDQCQIADVSFFFKQWGEWLPIFEQGCENGPYIEDCPEQSRFKHVVWDTDKNTWETMNGCWDDHEQWIVADTYSEPEQDMMRVGKRKAGRTFEGVTWDQIPEVKHD